MASSSSSRSLKEPKEKKAPTPTSNINPKKLKEVKVIIRRINIPESQKTSPLLRSLGNPFDLAIHDFDEGTKPIFDRDDVVVNKIEPLEERVVLQSPESAAKGQDSSKSYHRCRSRSSSPSNSSTRKQSRGRLDVSPQRPRGYKSDADAKTRAVSKNDYHKGGYRGPSPKKYGGRSPRRSRSREYRSREKSPFNKDYRKGGYHGVAFKEGRPRSISPRDRDSHKYYRYYISDFYANRKDRDDNGSRSKEETLKSDDDGERIRCRSPHGSYRPRSRSPRLHVSSGGYKRRSKSPRRPEGYTGPPSKTYHPKHRGRSPEEAPYKRPSEKLEEMPGPSRRSRSPRHHEGYKGPKVSYKTRRSRSPAGYKEYHRRSRSPEEYRRHKYEKQERRSRSLSRDRYRRRTPSPYRKRARSPEGPRSNRHSTREVGYVGPMLPELAFYGPEAYWIPETGPRFRPPMPAHIPLAGGMFRQPAPLVFLQRPMYPPPRFGPRLPIYNNRTIRAIPPPATSTSEAAETSSETSNIKNESPVKQGNPDSTINTSGDKLESNKHSASELVSEG